MLPTAHPSHEFPFMPGSESVCMRCLTRRDDRFIALRCIADGPIYGDDPQADAQEEYTLGPV